MKPETHISPLLLRVAVGASLVLLASCGGRSSPPEKVYSIASQQLPADDVYGRMRYGLVPLPLPARDTASASAPALIPVTHFDFKKGTLEEASVLLGKTMNYRSYCASGVAHKRLSLSVVGTIDEIARAIERASNIRVVVDHELHEVRFFPSTEGQRLSIRNGYEQPTV